MKFVKLFESFNEATIFAIAKNYVTKPDSYFEELIGCTRHEALEEPGLCSTVSIDFINFAKEHGMNVTTVTVPIAEKFWMADPTAQHGEMIKDHTANLFNGNIVIDLTLKQFGKQFDCPYIGELHRWTKIMQDKNHTKP